MEDDSWRAKARLLAAAAAAIAPLWAFSSPFQSLPHRLETFDFSQKTVAKQELSKLNSSQLAKLRGIVLGKHGRVFREPDIQEYLWTLPWYESNGGFSNEMLSAKERYNLDLIREAEAKKHKFVQPGDLRFWRDRRFTRSQLGRATLNELHIMAAEIEAIHGKRFDDQPSLQKYFEERYWYKPAAKFDRRSFSRIELANLATIRAVEKTKRNLSIAPGDMFVLQKTALKDSQLEGLTLYELRLLRNEIYALRGYVFETPWLSHYFFDYEWYRPLSGDNSPKLTRMDYRNIATIQKFEAKRHESLSLRPLKKNELEGLFLEDARKLRFEIEARHGKVFKQTWLQSYFSSMPWYKKNPSFKPELLTPVEKKNMSLIAAYEKKAQSAWNQVEG